VHNRKEYLRHLLHTEEWTIAEKEWMLQYLEGNDLSELEELAAEEFDADLITVKHTLDRKLSEKLLKRIHKDMPMPAPSKVRAIRVYSLRIAAAAAILLAAGIGYYSLTRQTSRQQVVTTAKERKTVTLPDGSLVSLEPGSTLQYPERFDEQTREVNLSGEAFFEVAHNEKQPFVIQSPLINTTVLATSFNVEARDAKEARVVVVSGRVQVLAKGQPDNDTKAMIVTANKSAVYNKATDHLEMEDAADDARFYSQKRNGKFVYKGVPLEKVVNDLERYYNTTIRAEKKIGACAFNGDFDGDDDLDKALTLIAISLNANIHKDSSTNSYRITGGSCQ
jgi:ferric-dicitrate binding protein FerR (iron transport regulator)